MDLFLIGRKWGLLPLLSVMSSSEEVESTKKPTVLITIGMAGSGKTTFMQVQKRSNLVYILTKLL